jgi:hypothetical protein
MEKRLVRPELAIFSLPLTEASISSSEYQPFYPISSYKESFNPIEFIVSNSNNLYLDLYNSYLYVKANITKSDGTKLPAGELVAPGNLFLHTMFQNCCVQIHGCTISDSANMYPYQAWIQNQLYYGTEKKSGELSTELYYKDSSPDDYNPATNPGFKARMDIASGSKSFEMIGRLENALFQQRRYIPTNTPVRVCLGRSPPEFALSCATVTSPCPYQINIDQTILYIKMQQVMPNLLSQHQKLFDRGQKSIYPYTESRVKALTIPTGSMGTVGQLLFSGQLPEIITVGLVTWVSAAGVLNKNPFNFAHHNLSAITLYVENEQKQINFDFSKSEYLTGYKSLFEMGQDPWTGNGISRADYINGNVLSVFQVRPTYEGALHQQQIGQVKLEMKFSSAVTEPLNVIVWARFQKTMQIGKNSASNSVKY